MITAPMCAIARLAANAWPLQPPTAYIGGYLSLKT